MNDLSPLLFEQQFLQFLGRHGSTPEGDVRTLFSRLLRATVSQHSCISVADVDPGTLAALADMPCVGSAEDATPFILHDNRLYLARFFFYEREVAAMITARNREITPPAKLQASLDHTFGQQRDNRQKLAALLALTRGLAIITGGPGTGKTSTVARILEILVTDNPDLQVKVTAPTGKATMRLAASLASAGNIGNFDVLTLHRLLGMRRDGRSFRHGPDNPVHADVLIVDEASMVDLLMMHRLLAALPDKTRLILLGDPDQLPSVDTGNVLSDLCAGDPGFSPDFSALAEPLVGRVPRVESEQKIHGLTDAVCRLEHTYRFPENSSVAIFSRAVRNGELPAAQADASVEIKPPYTQGNPAALLPYFDDYLSLLESGEPDTGELLEVFDRSRLLCSRRGGESGVLAVNRDIEDALQVRGLKLPDQEFYTGRPVLVTRNDYNLGLFNGDIGICHPSGRGGQFEVTFPGGATFLASRLPEHETCFAMTIHKSQGSEFDHVIILLGDETRADASELITRELLYTAITRCRTRVTLHASDRTLAGGVRRSAARVSGMSGFLGIQ